MKIYKTGIVKFGILALIGMGLMLYSLANLNQYQMAFSSGCGLVAVSLIKLIQYEHIRRNPQLFQKFENASQDERYLFIRQKSAAWCFWMTMTAEFIGLIIFYFLGSGTDAENIQSQAIINFASLSICIQTIAYLVIFSILVRKY